MLTRLLPDQIAEYWDIIKPSIEGSLPPVVGVDIGRMNYILSALLSGKLQCWASYQKVDEQNRILEAIVTTLIMVDDVSNTRSLLIYSVFGHVEIPFSSWREGFETLMKFASSRGCHTVTAYSDNPRVLQVIERLGGSTTSFITLPI